MNETTDNPSAGRDPADLEREASQIRADMDRTLDALERKFAPSQLIDRSLGYLREHGGELTQNVGEVVKRNPIPILMTVAGITWLVASSLRTRRNADDETFGDESPYAGESYASESYAGHSSLDESQGDGRLRATVTQTKERLRSTGAAAADKLSRAADMTRERTRRAQVQIESLVSERPLLLGGIAVAIGAVIGAVIPTTQYENKTVGQVRDRAVRRAKELGERQYENLRSTLETHRDIEVSGQAH
jgi:ElaB/YqjD/DUF883 family membrane-anchored ribosome-binding protein